MVVCAAVGTVGSESSASTALHSSRKAVHVADDCVRPDDVGRRRAGLLDGAEDERGAASVDDLVDQDRGDDLAAQRVAGHPVGVPLAQRRREVVGQHRRRSTGRSAGSDPTTSSSRSIFTYARSTANSGDVSPRPASARAASSSSVGIASSARSSRPLAFQLGRSAGGALAAASRVCAVRVAERRGLLVVVPQAPARRPRRSSRRAECRGRPWSARRRRPRHPAGS